PLPGHRGADQRRLRLAPASHGRGQLNPATALPGDAPAAGARIVLVIPVTKMTRLLANGSEASRHARRLALPKETRCTVLPARPRQQQRPPPVWATGTQLPPAPCGRHALPAGSR